MTHQPRRRQLRFQTIDEAVELSERLAAGQVETTGKFSYAQILEHLARAMDTVTGHVKTDPVPFPIRVVGRVIRPFLITRPFRPGIKLPKKTQSLLWPEDSIDVQTGLQHFKEAVDRFQRTQPLLPHPVFGSMSRAQHEQVQCRHAELHLSFVHPVDGSVDSTLPS